MDTQRLDHFIVLAEEKHFGRAAVRLEIDQSGLSRSIRRLEADLSLQLFVRSTRAVDLTTAGEAFLAEARNLVAQSELARQIARRLGTGEQGRLRIAFFPGA